MELKAEGHHDMKSAYAVAIFGGGLILTLISSIFIGSARATYPDILDCERQCVVAANGWPFPYLLDYPGLSVTGAASLVGALFGEDRFHLKPFLLTWGCWTLLTGMVAGAVWWSIREDSTSDL